MEDISISQRRHDNYQDNDVWTILALTNLEIMERKDCDLVRPANLGLARKLLAQKHPDQQAL